MNVLGTLAIFEAAVQVAKKGKKVIPEVMIPLIGGVKELEHQKKIVVQVATKAVEVVSIPLAGKSNIADHMVIASGRSTRQVASMAVKLGDKIKERFGKNVRIEGLPAADWVLIDADDVIVHIFRPEVRNFYNLERMWAFGDDSGVSAAARG